MTSVGTASNQIPIAGNNLRNIIEGADLVMSHILHFYHLTALDFIDTQNTIIDGKYPWTPKDQDADLYGAGGGSSDAINTVVLNYVTALDIRRECHRLGAYLSGKQPCQPALIPGGVTKVITSNDDENTMQPLLTTIRNFINTTYLCDLTTVAKAFSSALLDIPGNSTTAKGAGRGCGNYLAYGIFPTSTNTMVISGGFLEATDGDHTQWTTHAFDPQRIREYITYSFYDEGALGGNNARRPIDGVTAPNYNKGAPAYSWLKAPRYITGNSDLSGAHTINVAEVGPLARVLVNYAMGNSAIQDAVHRYITSSAGGVGLGINVASTIPTLRSVLGRHAARAIEAQVVADSMSSWISSMSTTSLGDTYRHRNIPRASSTGFGLTEAPRGALGHWMRIDGRKISQYQCVVPTTWNAGPKDSSAQEGPIEQAVTGCQITTGTSESASARLRVGRIVRSFDPCIACAVHIVTPDKKTITKFEVDTTK
jgi:hydrogenase large subunit